jgi:5-(aminomethyl)-3-furanmethanol phosphate kinase
MTDDGCTLIKIGGSLYDWPLLAERLRALLKRLEQTRVILFPGGGAGADAIRICDKVHRLGEEAAHWLALRALTVNAYFLQALLPGIPVLARPDNQLIAIVDPYAFAKADEASPGRLPHGWEVTSDSLAVRAAHVLGAHELLLLKSISLRAGTSWLEAARMGFVDAFFPVALAAAPGLQVHAVNLREISE